MTTLRETLLAAFECLDGVARGNYDGKAQDVCEALLAALAELQDKPVAEKSWADRAMELATDFGVDSLRVGSHERKDQLLNNGVYTFETTMLRDKRDASRDRLRRHIYTHPQRQPLTDEDIKAAASDVPAAVHELMFGHEITVEKFRLALNEFARAIEAKLKEKNT